MLYYTMLFYGTLCYAILSCMHNMVRQCERSQYDIFCLDFAARTENFMYILFYRFVVINTELVQNTVSIQFSRFPIIETKIVTVSKHSNLCYNCKH